MLKTRLDGRSEENSSFELKDENGTLLATIKLASGSSATLEVSTAEGLYIEKPSGWSSQRK
jgi:hypothetical protein|tara:strand:- start:103 stop:285 length:183 start_codon:yes stop_codon:yes gene_type:complete